ncbi:MAG TPA: PrgI family protein [Candidatus Saccharimonadales bacterium]|nr:PrgI family protein [Candidatus Saccharimonadales bacterium]
MAVYKVPQDVEAEDKLVGPFGFRQFIYLGIAGGLGFVAYLLFRLNPVLITIPLPIIGFFVILALPLRKEQPMETYLLALLRFYMKPKLRLWNPDGTITYVEIVAPKTVERVLHKEFGAETATERLDYLARVMDSRGWSLKGEGARPGASLTATVAAEAATTSDIMDDHAELAKSFDQKIAQKDEERRQEVVSQMRKAATAPPSQSQAITPAMVGIVPAQQAGGTAPAFNPYPTSMHQRVILPMGDQATQAAQAVQAAKAAKSGTKNNAKQKPASAVPPAVSPDIIRLANNDDLSISAIAHEAHRLSAKEGEEVVIELH